MREKLLVNWCGAEDLQQPQSARSNPPRVQPKLGEWGPLTVPTTKQKKRMRIWVGLALLGALIAIFLLGWYVYYVMTGSWGFGIGDERQFLATFMPQRRA